MRLDSETYWTSSTFGSLFPSRSACESSARCRRRYPGGHRHGRCPGYSNHNAPAYGKGDMESSELSFADASIEAISLQTAGVVEVRFKHVDGYENDGAHWSCRAILRLEAVTLILVTVAGEPKRMFDESDAVANWRVIDREHVPQDPTRLLAGVEFVSCWFLCGMSGTELEVRASRAVLTDVVRIERCDG